MINGFFSNFSLIITIILSFKIIKFISKRLANLIKLAYEEYRKAIKKYDK